MARYQHYQRRYKGYTDLRDFLDDKHQRGEEPNSVPYDPPSLLRDPLRGDNLQNNRHPRNEYYRGRGRYQRRPNYNSNYNPNYTRPRGYNTPRGYPSRLPANPTNIKIEFSTESGERKYQIESGNDISDRFNTGDRGRGGNYRGRFRGNRRGRGHRGSYYRRPRTDHKNDSENLEHVSQRNDREGVKCEEEENWDLPVEVQGSTQEKELHSDTNLKENEEFNDKLEEYREDDDENDVYVEGEYLDEEEEEEYYEGGDVQEEEVQSGLEENEKVDDAKSEEKDDEQKSLSEEKSEVKNDLEEDLAAKDDLKESKDDLKKSKNDSKDSKNDSKDSKIDSKDSKNGSKSTEITENKKDIASENK